ncbi:MAG: prolyl oligopeptidase family serine peptidase [Bacteroidota bacterium]
MRSIVFFYMLSFTAIHAQDSKIQPKDFGLEHFQIVDSTLGAIDFYVTKKGIDQRKPLLVLLDGSGHLPIYSLVKKSDGTTALYSSNPFRYNQLAETFHVVLISKPGVPFLDSLEVESYGAFMAAYQASSTYIQQLSLDWRVHSASLIIDYLINHLKIDRSNICAIGYSEGGQVVPKLALQNAKVTKIVNIVGGGLNQFNDFITAERLKAQKGTISADSAQTKIDQLLLQFEDIYNHPTSTTQFWLGHTYRRWASFCMDVPLENMLKLDIPILLISAGYDENSPITGIDYVALEFLRQKKTNLTYKVYPNNDHWFYNKELKQSQLREMIAFATNWIKT